MSGYFQRIAALARQGAPRRSAGSPFGPARPPGSHAQPTADVPSEVVVTSAPTVPASQPNEVQPSLRPEAESRRAEPRPVPTQQPPATPGGEQTHEQAPAPSMQDAPRSLGETVAADLAEMGLSPAGERLADAAQPAAQEVDTRSVVEPQPTVRPELAPRRSQPAPVPTNQGVLHGPAAARRTSAGADEPPRTLSETVAGDPAMMRPPAAGERTAGAAPETGKITPQPEPQRLTFPSGQLPGPDQPAPRPELARSAPAALEKEQAAAPVLPGPRARPDVEVSIGTVNLSTESPREAPAPESQARPARPSLTQSGIWSGGRVFTRSYLRR